MANIFEIFGKTAKYIFEDTDFTPAMIYLVDAVNSNALPFLASQFDVEGFKGWDLALTDKKKRELIKTAIAIKKHRGTPYAIKQALLAIGFDKVVIHEGAQQGEMIYYNGEHNYNGQDLFGGYNWAAFTVNIKIPIDMVVSDQTKLLIRNLILYYKNVRSNLIDIIWENDTLYYYNGDYLHDSSINYL